MNTLFLFVVIPLAGAFLCAIGRRVKNFGDAACNLAALCLCVLSVHVASAAAAGEVIVYKVGGWLPPVGICLVADGLSALVLAAVNLVSLLAMVYAISYMKIYTDKWKFHSLFMLMLAGMNGVVISGDLFNMYVFLELASLSGYSLVAFGCGPEDVEAAFKYTIMGSLASIFVLIGIGLLYSYTSTLNMADIASALAGGQRNFLVSMVSILFLAGFCLKAALVPFHAWLPDAHSSAPSPVSAALSGVFIKALGIYTLCRVFFNVLGVSSKLLSIFLVLGALSMTAGAILAIAQNDTKRMLAYSSISQIGYIVFALGIGTPLAVFGAFFHLLNHAAFKSLLFFNAGAVEYATGERRLNKLGGLNTRLPVTGYTGLLGSLSISGMPPLGGFWSKLIIILAALQSRHFGFAFIAAAVSIITLSYYLKFQSLAFFGRLNEAWRDIREVPFTMKLPMVILAFICATSGVMLLAPFRSFIGAAVNALLAGSAYKDVIFNAIKS